MLEKIIEILQDVRADVDFTKAQALVDNGILDSIDIAAIAGALMEEFDIRIGAKYLTPENFNSPEAIAALVEKLTED